MANPGGFQVGTYILVNGNLFIPDAITWSGLNTFTASGTAISTAGGGGILASGAAAGGSNIFAIRSTTLSNNLVITANDQTSGSVSSTVSIQASGGNNTSIAIAGTQAGANSDSFSVTINNNASAFFVGDGASAPKKVGTTNNTLDDGSNGDATITGTLTSKGRKLNITPKSSGSPYTVLATDENIIVTTGAGGYTVNLPAATGTGRIITVIKADSGAGAVTVTPNGADTIEGGANKSLANQYKKCVLLDGASAVWYDLAANLI